MKAVSATPVAVARPVRFEEHQFVAPRVYSRPLPTAHPSSEAWAVVRPSRPYPGA